MFCPTSIIGLRFGKEGLYCLLYEQPKNKNTYPLCKKHTHYIMPILLRFAQLSGICVELVMELTEVSLFFYYHPSFASSLKKGSRKSICLSKAPRVLAYCGRTLSPFSTPLSLIFLHKCTKKRRRTPTSHLSQ